MTRVSLTDGTGSFEVSVFEAAAPPCVVLFAVGGGGNPERHLPLLSSLVHRGCAVVAPHFERLLSSMPSDSDLLLRARRLRLALDAVACSGVPVTGVGHSIGATMLLALVGGQVWMRSGQRLPISPDDRIARLVLLAPATDFFRAPRALDAVRTPILAWAGSKDVVTPPAQAKTLQGVLRGRVPVQVRIVEGAGHFSFMDVPPPQTTEALPDRDAFLAELHDGVGRFVLESHGGAASSS